MRNMKRIVKALSVAALACMSVFSAQGQQNLRTAYFLDGYTYNYKLNPAFAPERPFTAFPLLGNLGIGVESNLALSTFLYPTGNGNLTTFLSPTVPDAEFLKKLNNVNQLNFGINETIMATGFRTGKAFHTIDIALKADVGASLPKDLFAFVKTAGSTGATSWDISRIGIRTNARMEVAYGYSRPIFEGLRVGARVKLLMGLVNANAIIDNMTLNMTGQEWSVKAHGKAEIAGPISFGTIDGSNEIDFEDIKVPEDMEQINEYLSSPSIGLAFDLGASYDFLDYFTASIAVQDLGFINWNNTTTAEMPGAEWKFNGFGTISPDAEIGDQLSDMADDLLGMLKMEMTGNAQKKSNALSATIHAAVEARMPFYERLSFGILGTVRADGPCSWTEGRLIMSVSPVNILSAAASYAISDFGHSLGAVLNIHLPGFNLYAGIDSILPIMNVTPQFIPIDALNTNLTMGLTFAFGKAEGRYRNNK